MYYTFVRIHKTVRTAPAMAAGATSKLWEIGDIIGVLEAWERLKQTCGSIVPRREMLRIPLSTKFEGNL
jgi:hypothetical protein